jgi:thiol peroxidase
MEHMPMLERKGAVAIGGKEMTVIGADVNVGDKAPTFVAQSQDWNLVDVLSATKDKVRIIAAVPSLSTSVCDRETRRFNQEAANLSHEIAIIVISADLPFTQKNWCGAAGIDQVMVVSDHLNLEFGEKYGCLVKEARLLRRAVFVVDSSGIVRYVDYMPALGVEPNYAAVLEAANECL